MRPDGEPHASRVEVPAFDLLSIISEQGRVGAANGAEVINRDAQRADAGHLVLVLRLSRHTLLARRLVLNQERDHAPRLALMT
ncbi:MAG: hypothetical protein ACREEM_29175 [Blastocatellia bacterium]